MEEKIYEKEMLAQDSPK